MSGLDSPELPPVYRPIWLREHGDAFAHARRLAPVAEAGTLVWVRRFDTADLAVVLEPEENLALARLAIFAGLNAAAAALADFEPAAPVGFSWPDAILLDGAVVGGARLAWPERTREETVPDWLVLGLSLRVEWPHLLAPGAAGAASLRRHGFAGFSTAAWVGRFAERLLVTLDEWGRSGPLAQVARWRARARDIPLSPEGDLLLPPRPLAEALSAPSWLDPATGEPGFGQHCIR